MNYLDRNEFNYAPSQEVVEALKNFDINKLCFYTRIYDEGKKSILSVYLSESYGIDEPQVLLGYGGEDILNGKLGISEYFISYFSVISFAKLPRPVPRIMAVSGLVCIFPFR